MNKEQLNSSINYLQLARLYANVFRGPEWQEWFVKEGAFYPRFLPDNEQGIDLALSWRELGYDRAYPLKQTAEYIAKELAKNDAVLIQVPEPDRPNPIGFGWGFSYQKPADIVGDKWSQASDLDKRRLTALVARWAGGLDKPFWYLSEVGVNPKVQRQGIGSEIVAKLIGNAPDLPIIMRTSVESSMCRIAQKFGFSQVMGPLTFRDEENKLIAPEFIIGNFKDPVNPSRVMFVKNAKEYYPNYLRNMFEVRR